MPGLIRVVCIAVSALAALVAAATADDPNPIWWQNYGGTLWDGCYSVDQALDGGFVLAGVNASGDAAGQGWVVKTDDKGVEEWSYMYGRTGRSDGFFSAIKLYGGDCVVAGGTESYGAGQADACLLRLDADGDTVWTRTYGGADIDEARDAIMIAGGYMLTGYTYSLGATLADVLVVRTDSNGNQSYAVARGGTDYEFGYAICESPPGKYIIAGAMIESGGSPEDVYLIQVDASGNKVWEKRYGGPDTDYAYDICRTHDWNYLVVGTTQSYGAGGSDVYVLKINSNGDTLWTKTFGGTGWDAGISIVQTYDYHYVIGGYIGAGDTDAYLLKIDVDGNYILSVQSGYGSGNEECWSLAETNNYGFILGGNADSFGNGYQAFLQRTTGAAPLISAVEDIPSDQGGQVRVSWNKSYFDAASGSVEITDYSIWRRIEPGCTAGGGRAVDSYAGLPRLGFPPGDWDYVTTVPARGEWEYNCVVPTLCDSTSGGLCQSYFFVSAETADPLEYYDSPVDSGYSVDNLAPGPPAGLHMMSETEVAWEEAPEGDFDYFAVYGSDDGDFGGADFIGYTIDIYMDVGGDVCGYYHVTATDFAGNEGEPATTQNGFAGVGGAAPRDFALRQNSPNPFAASTSICFDLPERSGVRIEVIDVSGRVVRTLLEETMPADRHRVAWNGRDDGGAELGPGIYFVRMKAGRFQAAVKMMLLR